MKHFENISAEEFQILQETLPKVGALIASADGKVDIDEKYWAEKITQVRTYGEPHELNEFYDEQEKTFTERFNSEVENLSDDKAEARQCLSDDIARVNDVLPKLEPRIGYLLYKSYTSFAKHIAKASGGVMGFFTIGSEEAKLVDLPMINKIEPPADMDEGKVEV